MKGWSGGWGRSGGWTCAAFALTMLLSGPNVVSGFSRTLLEQT